MQRDSWWETREGVVSGGGLTWNTVFVSPDEAPTVDTQQCLAWAVATSNDTFEVTYSSSIEDTNEFHTVVKYGWSAARFVCPENVNVSFTVTSFSVSDGNTSYFTDWNTGEFSAPKDSLVVIGHTNSRLDSAPVPAPDGYQVAAQSSGQDSYSRLFYKIPDTALVDETVEGNFHEYDSDHQTIVLVFTPAS